MKTKIYHIGVTNFDSIEFDNASEVILQSNSPMRAGFASEISPNFSGFNLRSDKVATVIYFQITEIIGTKQAITRQKLKVFYGPVPMETLRKAYNDATSGIFEKKNPTTNGEQPDTDYTTPQHGLPIGSENGGFLPGLGDVPKIIWLIGAGYGVLKLIDTNNPLYALGAGFSFLQYKKKDKIGSINWLLVLHNYKYMEILTEKQYEEKYGDRYADEQEVMILDEGSKRDMGDKAEIYKKRSQTKYIMLDEINDYFVTDVRVGYEKNQIRIYQGKPFYVGLPIDKLTSKDNKLFTIISKDFIIGTIQLSLFAKPYLSDPILRNYYKYK